MTGPEEIAAGGACTQHGVYSGYSCPKCQTGPEEIAARCRWCGRGLRRGIELQEHEFACYRRPSHCPSCEQLARERDEAREALREADALLAGMWSYNDDSRKALAHTWPVKASDVLRAALGEERT